MSWQLRDIMRKKTFPRGVHPPHQKDYSADCKIEIVPCPDKIVLPLNQHIGAPSKQLVEKGQHVMFGELIAESSSFVSVPIHSPVAGTVQKNATVLLVNGKNAEAIVIKSDKDNQNSVEIHSELIKIEWSFSDIDKYSAQEIRDKVINAGIVGLGGAAFPTHVKITLNENKPVDTLILNGCECEPFITKDYRVMMEFPKAVVFGAMLSAKAVGARKIVIGVEDNKPKAIDSLRTASEGTGIEVVSLKTKYPQGSEKQLIYSLTGLAVPLGGLPSDVGVGIGNVGTMAAVSMAVVRNRPLTHRVVSVTGGGVVRPANLLVPIGISFGDLINYCGGLNANAARLLAGGPMMGFSFVDPDSTIMKGMNGLTVLTVEDLKEGKETSCVRCGKCVDVCPMKLVPTKLAAATRHSDLSLLEKYHLSACIECGCCAYSCPAKIPLVQLIRMGKNMLAASKN